MSELSLISWKGVKNSNANSVPKGTWVFVYIGDKKTNPETDAANEFFIKRQLGLDEEEQAFDDTNDYLDGIGKQNKKSMTYKSIVEITTINLDITKFVLNNLHRLYWRDYDNGVISTIDPNRALQLILPAAIAFRKVLVENVNKKYKKELTLAGVQNIVESHDLETKQALGSNIKNINKKK